MTKISKARARKLYANKEDFIMCASNLRPDLFGLRINADSFEHMINCDFDTMVNEFWFYNCANNETGKRVAFYTE